MPEEEEYLTVTQVRELAGLNKVRMAELIRNGTFTTVPDERDARVKLIARSQVEAWLKRQRRRADQKKLAA